MTPLFTHSTHSHRTNSSEGSRWYVPPQLNQWRAKRKHEGSTFLCSCVLFNYYVMLTTAFWLAHAHWLNNELSKQPTAGSNIGPSSRTSLCVYSPPQASCTTRVSVATGLWSMVYHAETWPDPGKRALRFIFTLNGPFVFCAGIFCQTLSAS